MGCGGLCNVNAGGGCTSCQKHSHARNAQVIQQSLLNAQARKGTPQLGGIFGRVSGGFANNSRGLGGGWHPTLHRGGRGLGQILQQDQTQSDYTNLGWDDITTAAVAGLAAQYDSGTITPAQFNAQLASTLANVTLPNGTADTTAADYQNIGWPATAAATAATNAANYNSGTFTTAQYASAMQTLASTLLPTSAALPAATGTAATTASSTPGLTAAQQAAVDAAAITGATSVLNTGIAGVVAATKGTTLANAAAAVPATTAAATASTALTSNQKLGLGIGAVVLVGGLIWYMSSSTPTRRRRRR